MQNKEWQHVIDADEKFISQSATAFSMSKGYLFDIEESVTTWFATRIKTDRQPEMDVCFAEKTIPNRMDYFDVHLGKYIHTLCPLFIQNIFSYHYSVKISSSYCLIYLFKAKEFPSMSVDQTPTGDLIPTGNLQRKLY